MRPLITSEDANAESFTFDLKPTLPDDAWAVLLTRVGIAIILVTQPLFIISEVRLGGAREVDRWLLIGFHLFNFAAALSGLGISWTRGFPGPCPSPAFPLFSMLTFRSPAITI